MASVLRKVIQVDEEEVRSHVDEVVRSSVEATLNGLLEAEADQLCGATRYERSPDRVDTRAGSYERKFDTKAGRVTLKAVCSVAWNSPWNDDTARIHCGLGDVLSVHSAGCSAAEQFCIRVPGVSQGSTTWQIAVMPSASNRN